MVNNPPAAKDDRHAAYLSLLLWELHVVKDPEDDSEQVLPPVFLKRVPVGLHHFKHHRQPPEITETQTVLSSAQQLSCIQQHMCLPGPDIQLTPVDDAGQLKENREPPPHPHAVFGGYIHVITGVIFEGLQEQ